MKRDQSKINSGSHLILGGTGFIGRHVAVALARSGGQVVLASRNPPSYSFPHDVMDAISWLYVDMGTVDWLTLLPGVTSIHHYAWNSLPASAQLDPAHDLIENVVPIIKLLEALRYSDAQNIPLIFASSGGTVYGKLKQTPVDESHSLMPITAYGVGKVSAERYLALYRHLYNLDCRIARIANPYGAGQSPISGQGVATTFIFRALSGKDITVWGDGSIVRDFIHISDIVSGLLAISEAPRNLTETAIFNLGTGLGQSILSLLREIQLNVGYELKVRFELGREYDVPISVLNCSHAESDLGWHPRKSFADGISQTIGDLRRGDQLDHLLSGSAAPPPQSRGEAYDSKQFDDQLVVGTKWSTH